MRRGRDGTRGQPMQINQSQTTPKKALLLNEKQNLVIRNALDSTEVHATVPESPSDGADGHMRAHQ